MTTRKIYLSTLKKQESVIFTGKDGNRGSSKIGILFA